jgi:hypothetical protein
MRTGLVLASLLAATSTAYAFDPPVKTGSLTLCTQIVDLKYAQVGSGVLGAKVGGVHLVNDGFCWQEFTKGRIHTGTLSTSVTVVITGSVLSQFRILGYEAGFGQAFAPINEPNGVVRHPYKQGFIIVHPSFGTRGIKNPLASLWNDNNSNSRFGYPTTDLIPTPNGGYNTLERGYVARTNEMGSWIDFTGGGEGKTLARVNLYADWYFGPTPITKYLAGESPVSLRAQFGSLDNRTSSLTLNAPTRTSLYLYDESPLEGRYTRITGADQSKIQIQALGTWMNDKPSSMVLVNHGSVSMSKTRAPLATTFTTAINGVHPGAIVQHALIPNDSGAGSLDWNDDTSVTFLPGERLIQVSRTAVLTLYGDCVPFAYCNDSEGTVEFSFLLRPELAMMAHPLYPSTMTPTVRLGLVDAIAFSLGCDGHGCDDRNDALDVLFDDPTIVAPFATAFAKPFDSDFRTVADQLVCAGLGARRVNVLPERLEFVMGDTAYHASCATGSSLRGMFDGLRTPAVITNHNPDGTIGRQFDGIYNVVPDYSIILPPAVFN